MSNTYTFDCPHEDYDSFDEGDKITFQKANIIVHKCREYTPKITSYTGVVTYKFRDEFSCQVTIEVLDNDS